jgi:hypothetical protein
VGEKKKKTFESQSMVHVLLLLILLSGALARQTNPEHYQIEFDTTVKVGNGKVVIDVVRSNAPRGADRLYELLTLSEVPFPPLLSLFVLVK